MTIKAICPHCEKENTRDVKDAQKKHKCWACKCEFDFIQNMKKDSK